MKHLTEKEILQKQVVDLYYCSLLERDGIVTLDELSDLIPGYIHLNNLRTGGLEYLNKKALGIFEKSITEIKQLGKDFINQISDKKSQQMFDRKQNFFKDTANSNKVFSYIQRLQYKTKKIPYTLLYSTSKKYNNDFTISFTQPLKLLQDSFFLKEIVEERYIFFNENYWKFALLTKRECEILKWIAHGDGNKLIADKLCISYHTVKTHRKNICNKLETNKIFDLFKYFEVFLNDPTSELKQ
jgi:DNA-binding CsgD family transcriptional regulator